MTYSTGYETGRQYTLDGQLLNREHESLNALSGERGASYGQALVRGAVSGETVNPPTVIGIAKITSAANTGCGSSQFIGESDDAPCANEDLYVARFRFYDADSQSWQEYEEDLPLDAGVYFESDPTDASKSPVTSASGAGHIPAYAKGDVTPAYWDEQRAMLVPIQSPYQDVVQVEVVTKTDQLIPLLQTHAKGPIDSFCEMYLQIKRPGDSDWLSVGSISWRLPYLDSLREWRDSRSGFTMFAAPHGTLVRLVAVRSSEDVVVSMNWAQLLFWGAGRKNIGADFVPSEVTNVEGVRTVTGFELRADTAGRFKDSPSFSSLAGDVHQITYDDPLDSWIIGIQFSATIYNDLPQTNFAPTCLDVITSIDCENGHILEYCKRNVCFPAELANRMTIGSEECTSCQPECGSADWEWDGQFWVLVQNLCAGQCRPRYPDIFGTTVGQTTSTLCGIFV